MDIILLQISVVAGEPYLRCEVEIRARTTLAFLRKVIRTTTGLPDDKMFEYDVMGYRAPGGNATINDLIAQGVTRFRYLHKSTPGWHIELLIEAVNSAPAVNRSGRCYPRLVGNVKYNAPPSPEAKSANGEGEHANQNPMLSTMLHAKSDPDRIQRRLLALRPIMNTTR